MKKFLLSLAAVCCAALYASAGTVVYEKDFSGDEKFPFFVMGYEPTIVNGILTAEYPGSWYQFFIADNIPTKAGETYIATVKLKASVAGSVNMNMGWGWGDGEQMGASVELPTEWKEVSVTYKEVGGEKSNLVLQPGSHEGTVEVEWVKVELAGEIVLPTPTESNTVASFYDGNGKTFGGWGGTFEQVEEDGKPCLKYVNDEAKDFWAAQMAIDLEYTPGITYYFSFDVKGDGKQAITSGYQYAGPNDAGDTVYVGCGDLDSFKASSEWKTVVISGTPKATDEGRAPGRWVANLGQYVGTLYLTNVKVFVDTPTGIAAPVVAAPENGRTVVYNLMGMKVLDTDDASAVKNLAKGIYIVNGKKVAVR